ncbi:Nodulation protein D 2 [compost metagenome]
MERLDQHHYQVGHAHGCRVASRLHPDLPLAAFILYPQPAQIHRLDMRLATIQQPGFVPRLAQGRTNGATQGAGAQNADFQIADLLWFATTLCSEAYFGYTMVSIHLLSFAIMSTLDALPDPKLLQLFDVLYHCRSVTRSAEQLGQSQPTVSIWLGRLREELNDPLFVRTPGGMAPTPRADQLIGPCREVLESLRRLTTWEPQFVPATAQRRFRLCVSDASHITLLPSILNHLRTHAPGIRLEAARIDGNTESALESGEADLAIGFVPWLGAGMYQQVLFEQDWVCLSNPRHPRLGQGMSVERYQAEGHVQISAGTGQKLLEAGLARAGIERRIMLELPAFLGLGMIVGSTDLVATLPRHIGQTLADMHGLQVHDCPFAVEGFTVKQHWHARYQQDSGNRWMREVVRDLFQKGTS